MFVNKCYPKNLIDRVKKPNLMFSMLLMLMLLNTSEGFGIGFGTYPNGFISFKFHSSSETVFQITAGPYWTYSYYGSLAVGGRALFPISKGGNNVEYTHFLGAGAGIWSWESGVAFVGEGFYEFELFPDPKELPLSLEIGIGLTIVPQAYHKIEPYIPLGIHFYIK